MKKHSPNHHRPLRRNIFYFFVTAFALLFATEAKAQDPPQYNTPFASVPDTRDVNMYQAHIRPYSAAGNLAGVIARLDAIKALGTNVIYLMPIYPHGTDSRSSPSPYCIKDYKSVAAEYGTLTDLRSLVDGAHSRGMAVILDIAINGTSWDHPWITAHPDWYNQSGGVIQQLASFPDIAGLNFANTAMRAALVDAMRYWVFAANVDGYRCDFANNPPLDFWTNTIANLRTITTHKLLMFAEGDRLENFQTGFDMNFGDKWYYDAISKIATGLSVSQIQTTTNTEYADATGSQMMVRYTSNHDVETNTTAIQAFGGHAGVIANYLVSAYMRGVPFLTSGQEVDFNQTIPWPYTTVKINFAANLGAAADFTKVINYRNSSEAIRRGTMANFSDNNVCAFTKTSTTTAEKVVVMVNLRNSAQNYVIPASLAGSYKDAYTNAAVTLTSGATQALGAFQYIVLTNANVTVVPVTGVTVSPTTAAIVVGATQQLTATIAPANATNQAVTWTSSNTAVASVSSSGLVTGVGAGNATITVKTNDGAKTATCAVTVSTVAVTGVTVSPTTASLSVGTTQQVTATVAPANASNKSVSWSSSNTAIATVSASGLVTAVAVGSANITVTTADGAKTAICAVTVHAAVTLTVNFYRPASWGTAIKIYWWSAMPAGVLADGTWPGVAMTNNGNNWYSYTFTNVTSTNLIFNDGTNQTADLNRASNGWYLAGTWYNTQPTPVTGITVTPTTASVAVGATQQLTGTVAPSTATNKAVTWTSSNTGVATVNSAGLVTAVASGTATITVTTTESGFTATCAVTVPSNGTRTYYNIINRWQANTYLYDGGNGQVKYGTTPTGNSNYQWAQVDAGGGFILLKNRATGNLMNVENQNGQVQCNVANTTWYSAMWTINPTGDGWNYIENRWMTSDWINIEGLAGYAQYSGASPGFYSAEWQFVNPVVGTGALNAISVQTDFPVVDPSEPHVHQGLSPNGDGINDGLIIDNIQNYPENSLVVINTNGEKVYEASSYDNANRQFTGKSSTKRAMLPAGTYFYRLQYKSGGIVKNKSGYIILKY